ncbi:MAG: hypothetical protein Fur0032_11050 [Terrimicrobiaceae bacterium]
MKVVFAVVLAKCPTSSAGHTCAIMNWALSFRAMGWDVWLVEHLDGEERAVREDGGSIQEDFWRETCAEFGFSDRQCLIVDGASSELGAFREFAAGADLFFNYSGQFRRFDLLGPRTVKCYMDVDPGFTQLWAETCGVDMNFEGHDRFLTVGTNLNGPDVLLPPSSRPWIPVAPPVATDYWRKIADNPSSSPGHWSTVSHWYGYNDLVWEGRTYGGKRNTLLELRDLPQKLGQPIVIATDLAASWGHDYDEFVAAGWLIESATEVCRDVPTYLKFLSGSLGELGIAKQGYLVSRGGWISDRSVTYLAFGRPVLLQDTGWTATIPPGPGLLPFMNADDAVARISEIGKAYDEHREEARQLAATTFSPRGVLEPLLTKIL